MNCLAATDLHDYEQRELAESVAAVLDAVRRRGDEALLGTTLRVSATDIERCLCALPTVVWERLADLPVDPADLRVTVSAMGGTQLPITTMACAMGLNIRVGMEDNVIYRRGQPVRDNAELVARAVRIAAELERWPATPSEARELLGVRGRRSGELPALAVVEPVR